MSLGDEREATRVIHRAVEAGVNFFDTADLYDRGLNEELVGRILKGRRDNRAKRRLRPRRSVAEQLRRRSYIWQQRSGISGMRIAVDGTGIPGKNILSARWKIV